MGAPYSGFILFRNHRQCISQLEHPVGTNDCMSDALTLTLTGHGNHLSVETNYSVSVAAQISKR